MIAKKYKVPKQAFPKVLQGKHVFANSFKVVISPSLSQKNAHMAVVLSKKSVKKAHQRNFIKRMIYTACQNNLKQIPIQTYIFLSSKPIVFLKDRAKNKLFKQELKQDIENLVQKMILCKK